MSVAVTVKEFIYDTLSKYPILANVSDRLASILKVDRLYVLGGLFASVITAVFFVGKGKLFMDLLAFVYPFLMTMRALDTGTSGGYKQWLVYWIIFMFLRLIDDVFVVNFIPLYFPLKMAFLLWCFYPSTKGSIVIYDVIIKGRIIPFLMIKNSNSNLNEKKTN